MTLRRPRTIAPFHYPLIALAVCSYAASTYAAPVAWTPNASGSWTTAANWSSTPSLPGPADDVTINQPGPLTVTLSSGTQSINSLLNDNTLILSTSGTLAVATTAQVNGNLTLNGGTLLNATLSTGAPGVLNIISGTFDGVTLASNLTINDKTLSIKDGLTLSNTKLSLLNGELQIVGNQTIGGTGILEFDGTGTSDIDNNGSGVLTLGANITLQTGIGTGTGSIALTSLINQGLISAQNSGKTIIISTTTSLTNTGILQAINGGAIILESNLTTAGLGNFNSTGGNITIAGTLDNTASTLALNGVGNSLILSGTIKNGNLSVANGAVLTSSNNGILDGVTLLSNLSVANSVTMKDALTLSNSTLALTNSIALSTGSNATIGATAGGTGIIEFDGTGSGVIENLSTGPTLTIGSNITVQTGSASGSIVIPTLLNQGVILAQNANKTLTITTSTSFTNMGILEASNNGTLKISSSLTTAQLGTFNSDPIGATSPGTIQISGTLDNTGSILALNGIGNSLLLSGTIENGTISTANGAVLAISSGGTLDGVTLASNLPVNNTSLNIKDGLTLSNITLSLNSNSTTSSLGIGSNQTIGGTGIIEFDGIRAGSIGGNGFTLTIGANVTLQTGTGLGTIAGTGLINQGLISAQTSGDTLAIGSTTFTNAGTIQVLNGGILDIQASLTTAGLGTFNSTGGTIKISGILDNSNSTLALNGVGNSLSLVGTIKNGTVSTANGAMLTILNGTFDGATLASNLTISASSLIIKDGLTLANTTLSLNSVASPSALSVTGSQTIGGTGVIEFDGSLPGTFAAGNGNVPTLTIAPNITVQTGTGSGSIATSGLINQGLISAQTSGKSITINTTTFTNTGTLQALNGGTINILSNIASAGLGTFNSTGGTIQISGTLDNSNSTLTLNGIGNSLLLTGTIKNGNVSLAGGAQLTMNPGVFGTFNVANLTVAAGGTFNQGGGTTTLAALSQSGGNISLDSASQALYTIPSVAITGGTTMLTKNTAKVLTTTSLTFGGATNAWTGELDLTQNKAIVEATPTTKSALLTALENQAFFGRSNPAGIISSTITSHFAVAVIDNALLGKTTFATQPVDPNSILIAPELLGDSNIDGKVDLTDLNTVLNNLGTANTNWTSGNFDDAATIDLTDLNDVLNNLGTTFANPSTSALSTQSPALSTPAPEPATLSVLVLGALLLTRRRTP